MKNVMYLMAIMAQVGIFTTVSMVLWFLSSIDVLKIMCIAIMISTSITLPIMVQIEEWAVGKRNK